MKSKPSLKELLEVQNHFGLPSPALVEKDWHVVQALAAISRADTTPFRLIFGGGTSLSRAHRLIGRMSEDIDLKIIGDAEPKRAELRQLREALTRALLAADFRFDPQNTDHRYSGNESRYTLFRLPYVPLLSGSGALRPEIKIEMAVWPLRSPLVDLPVTSFVAEAFGLPPEVPGFACVAVTQTAAEKFVALTRRVAAEQATPVDERDTTLVRHIYDLHILRPHYDLEEVAALAETIIPHDSEVFGRQFPPYRDNPLAETRQALVVIQNDPHYAQSYADFHRDMVYGADVGFSNAMGTLQELAERLPD